ncbi:MAG: ATPase, T2SS/T4P/T4SS family [Sulfolobales archaeon]|nr:ATPase, T2SS/T4P/T4SS family [Sulfolobales archaeon]MDW8083512.1 ATPase, T2SS/T4P/T4SS family [Sulfolobales archaeon]
METLFSYNIGLSSISILRNPSRGYYYLVNDIEPEKYEAIAKLVSKALEHVDSRKNVGIYDIAKAVLTYLKGYNPELVTYVVNRELKYKKLQVFLDDPYVEDISIVGPGSVWVRHKYVLEKDPLADYIETNVMINTYEELMSYMELIAERSGRVVNRKTPIMDFTLPEEDGGHRVHIVLPDVAHSTGEIVVRKKLSYTSVDLDSLVDTGMITPPVVELIKIVVRRGGSIVILGPPGSGKTTLLKAVIYSAVPAFWKIAIIEDTPEIDTPKGSSWVRYTVPTNVWGSERGIDQMALAKAALRASVSKFLVIGETRGAEARILVQAMNMGLGGLCLPADQLLLARVDGRIDLYEIRAIVEGMLRGMYRRVEVVSIGPELKPVWRPVSAAVVKNGSRRFIRIEVDSGATHEVHESHDVVVVDSTFNLTIKKAGELKPGDILASFHSLPNLTEERKFVDLLEASRCSSNTENSDSRSLQKVESNIAGSLEHYTHLRLVELNEDLGYIFGLYAASGRVEGDSSENSTSIYFNIGTAILDRVVESLKRFKVEKIRVDTLQAQEGITRVLAESRLLSVLLSRMVGEGVDDSSKRVPLDLLIESTEEFRIGFLRGYCDGLGPLCSFSKDGVVEIHTQSRKVAESLSLILKTLKVSSSVRPSYSRGREHHTVYVDRDIDRFLYIVRKKKYINEDSDTSESLKRIGELTLLRVRSTTVVEKDSLLYDIEVPEVHLYAISGSLILTHNTTFHAGSPEEAIVRLTSPPIELTPQQLSMIWLFITLGFIEREGLRRVVTRVDEPVFKSGTLFLNTIYRYGESLDLDTLIKRFSRVRDLWI